MKTNIHWFLHHPSLNEDENRAYRNFNIFLLFGILDIIIIAVALYGIGPSWPFYMCGVQFVFFIILLRLHIRGYFVHARFITFLLTIMLQAMACLTHGRAAGFDFVFFIISVLPMMFFDSRRHYITLFILSISTHLIIQYNYEHFTPIILIDSTFPLYWNIFFTGSIIFGVMYVFKRGYQRTQESLKKQNTQIIHQKEEIEVINNNLENIVIERTKKILEHEKKFIEFANINAHKVKSPFARIQGLLNLIELENDKQKAFTDFLPVIKANVEDLDNILKEVDTMLNNVNLMIDQGNHISSGPV